MLKNPSPSMAKSKGLPVSCKKLVSNRVGTSETTCMGALEPIRALFCPSIRACSSCSNEPLTTREARKPGVRTLAMLLASTSRERCWVKIPDAAV